MKQMRKETLIEHDIRKLKDKLDSIVNEKEIRSEKILRMSRQLDNLIVGYYNMKN